mmetsp:Transcript_51114/g.132739  ORF Transcript_51114/g.132739 Transcript_51114/m.132739 type:complete len:208 (-) Transcript_51114:133-756(-)
MPLSAPTRTPAHAPRLSVRTFAPPPRAMAGRAFLSSARPLGQAHSLWLSRLCHSHHASPPSWRRHPSRWRHRSATHALPPHARTVRDAVRTCPLLLPCHAVMGCGRVTPRIATTRAASSRGRHAAAAHETLDLGLTRPWPSGSRDLGEDVAVDMGEELAVGHHLARLILGERADEAAVALTLLDRLERQPAARAVSTQQVAQCMYCP